MGLPPQSGVCSAWSRSKSHRVDAGLGRASCDLDAGTSALSAERASPSSRLGLCEAGCLA